MVSIEAHKESVRVLIEDIKEKLRAEIAVERQKLIGFSCSEASCDLLVVLLHKKNLINPGFNINHRFFSSIKTAEVRFNFEFPSKNKLISLLVKQEEYRDILCYGKPKRKEPVIKCIENLFEIKRIIEKETGENL